MFFRYSVSFFIAAMISSSMAFAAGDWSSMRSTVFQTGIIERQFQFRTGTASTSEALDVSMCSQPIIVKWDPSTSDTSNDARGWLVACDTSSQAVSECRRVIPLGSTSDAGVPTWSVTTDGFSSINGYPFNKFIRASITTTPTGGDVAAVELRCRQAVQDEAGAFETFLESNRTQVDFQNIRHTSCNNAACTPNDPLTPFWVRQAIGSPVSDTFVASSTLQVSGEGVIDPGSSASTGVQYSLPFAQSLNLISANRIKFPYKRFLFRASFWRSGTTAVLAAGLCGTTTASAADPMLTTGGAFVAGGEFIGVKWNTAGTFTSDFQGSSSGSQTKTTAESFTSVNYHEVVIRPLIRNVGLDASNGLDLAGADAPEGGIVIEIDGIQHDIITDDDVGLPFLSTKQLTPCISAVNVGGTADQANFADIDWVTEKQRGVSDDN
jgi:hypothetical protein